MLPAGCTLRSGLWLQMIGCVSVSLSLSQNVITTLVRNPSLRDSFVVAGDEGNNEDWKSALSQG